MSASLSGTLPNGVPSPSANRRLPRTVGATPAGLVYLTVTSTAQVGFSAAPSFTFTLPSAGVIPTGAPTYLLFYDPTASTTGWVPLLSASSVANTTVVFPGVATGVTFWANVPYIFALAYTTQPVPTATPAPSPTPRSALPAYCSNYSVPVANANSAPQRVTFVDKSGTGAQVYLYVVTGSPPGTSSTQTQYLATNGTLTNFTTGATAPPFPLVCFPGSTGGTGPSFYLPPPTNANQSGNLYIAYATPAPGGGPANPLPFVGTSNGGYAGPSLDWSANLPSGASEYVATPWDLVEYTLPNGVTDLTQVDKVGLPLQLVQGTNSIGFASGTQYQNLLNAIVATPTYSTLAVSGVLNGRSVLARILAPQDGLVWGMPQDYWYNGTYTPSAYSTGGQGYVGYILSQYKATPRVITLNGIAGFSGNYCASSDGTSNMLFSSIGAATTCPSPLGAPNYTMPVFNTLKGGNASSHNICYSSIFSMPYGGPGGPIADLTEFYLWKAMVTDLARGVALSTSTHPVDGWNTAPAVLPPFSDFYTDPVSNVYAKLVHTYMIGNRSYALPYDEPGGYAPTFTSVPSQTLQITVQPIPSFNAPVPTVAPTPLACPT